MVSCFGTRPVGTKTDDEMAEFVSSRGNDLGVSNAELLRRLLEHYRENCRGKHACPHCGSRLQFDLEQ